MITDIDESKTLTKHISCKCKRRFDGKKYKSNQRWNNGKCLCGYEIIDVKETNFNEKFKF